MRGEPLTDRSDIWSLGVVFYELNYNMFPFKADSQRTLLQRIENLEFRKSRFKIHPELREIVDKMLSLDPKQRPSINELLRNPKMKKYNKIIQEANPLVK